MALAFWLPPAIAASITLAGPPKLPPLPSPGMPTEKDVDQTEPTGPKAQKPKPKPEPSPKKPAEAAPPVEEEPFTAKPPQPPADEASEPAPAPDEAEPGEIVEVEPPQPASNGPPSETSEPAADEPSKKRPVRADGPGAMDPGSGAPGEIPGGEDDERPRLRIPPPERPPYSGLGLFIGAGATFAVALAEQIVAHVLVKRRCIDPAEAGDFGEFDENEDAEKLGEVVVDCIPGVVPALALRVHSDIGLLAMIGLATGGAMTRGRRDAYDDVFGERPRRKMVALRAAGISLIGVGVVTWFTTGAASWGLLAACKSGKCATRARLMNFTTRDTGFVLIAAGGGMLGYAEAYRRNFGSYSRDKALSFAPTFGPHNLGVTLSGRF